MTIEWRFLVSSVACFFSMQLLMCKLMGVNYVFEQFFILSGLWQMSKKKLTSRETYQEAKDKFFWDTW